MLLEILGLEGCQTCRRTQYAFDASTFDLVKDSAEIKASGDLQVHIEAAMYEKGYFDEPYMPNIRFESCFTNIPFTVRQKKQGASAYKVRYFGGSQERS